MHLVLESGPPCHLGRDHSGLLLVRFSLTKIKENAVMFGGHLSGIDYSANVYTLKLSDMVSLLILDM